MAGMAALDPHQDIVDLTAALVDIESVSGNEQSITDAIEEALSPVPWLELWRHSHSLVARTTLGRDERVVIAGHVDTVPLNANLPSRIEDGALHGLGSCDMKGGVAVALQLAATVDQPTRDLTYVFYEAEEVEAERNGLTLIAATREEMLQGDFAVVMEPSNAVIEAGCQGTITVVVSTAGTRAHAARSWNSAASMPSTRLARCSTGWRRTSRDSRRSTGCASTRASMRWASRAGWRATWCRTRAR